MTERRQLDRWCPQCRVSRHTFQEFCGKCKSKMSLQSVSNSRIKNPKDWLITTTDDEFDADNAEDAIRLAVEYMIGKRQASVYIWHSGDIILSLLVRPSKRTATYNTDHRACPTLKPILQAALKANLIRSTT